VTPPLTSIRGWLLCMTAADWSGFSDALREKFPAARFFLDPGRDECRGAEPPALLYSDTLSGLYPVAAPRFGSKIIMYFDADWTPAWRRLRPLGEETSPPWVYNWPPHPMVLIRTGRGVMHQDGLPPYVDTGTADVYRTPGDKAHESLSRAFFRVLGKFVTNRDQVSIAYPSYAVVRREPRGSGRWCGHDALRWVRESPDRLLFWTGRFSRGGFGVRPADLHPE